MRAKATLWGAVSAFVVVLCGLSVGQAETIRTATGLNYHDSARAYEGYTLFAAQGNNTTYLLDMEGNVVESGRATKIMAFRGLDPTILSLPKN